MRRLLPWFGWVLLVCLIQGCAGTGREPAIGDRVTGSPSVGEPEVRPIILGAVYSLTGGQAGLDVPSLRGAQLAVGQANSAGGVLGRPVQLIVMDAASDPLRAGQAATALLKENPSVTALFGLSDTDLVLAAAPAAAAGGRLFLTSGATSPKLPDRVPGFLFLACFGDNVQAAAGAEWAIGELGARTVSVLFNSESTYARLLQRYFRTRFQELGGRVVSVSGYVPRKGLSGLAANLKAAELIYLAATPDEVLSAVRALRKAGHEAPILGGDGFDVAGLWQAHPEAKQIFFTTHAFLGGRNSNPEAKSFGEAYRKAFSDADPDAFAALGYDAVRLLLQAIEKAGHADPESVRAALAGIEEFPGVTGTIGFQTGSGIPLKSVAIIGADRGELRLVRDLLPKKIPPP